jgi:glycosyltransferase involved in cell wall biosynthesis
MPLRARGACNVFTLHDLVPLRLPFATLDNKRRMYDLLKKIAAKADHIVTVSENSRQDIIRLLGVEEARVTNTYQAVSFPPAALERSDDEVADELEGSYGLTFGKYLLFYGAIEPKKNVGRLIEAYLSSGVETPLVLVSSGGWQNRAELRFLAEHRPGRREVRRLEFVSPSLLVSLIRGAAAGVFPSLYEGFGLPVLECMQLGTPVITSREASLPEVAGEAALLVDPYSVAEIAGAIRKLANDADLRGELARRGRAQAGLFTPERYRARVAELYERIG